MKAYQIKITLQDTEPLVWRRFVVPAQVTFKRLHDTIQYAMNWLNYHLYDFRFPGEKLRVTNDEESYHEYWYHYEEHVKKGKPIPQDDPFDFVGSILETRIKLAENTKIDKYLEKYGQCEYVYDFGDNWRLTVELEKTLDDYTFVYPRLLGGEGNSPPEDVGGIYGFEEFKKAWYDPHHPEHEDMRIWGEGQEYSEFDKESINNSFQRYLKLKRPK